MWPSQRLASNDLESAGQGVAQARRRDRRGIRPIVTLLEERFLLSTLNLTVTTLADPSGPTGTVSLRQAIVTANADTIDSQENINFAASLAGTIDLTTALPNLANNISINGPGASVLTVQRDSSAAQFSVFTIGIGNASLDSSRTVSLSGMTIADGLANYGGGISNGSTLILDHIAIINNEAVYSGGGIISGSCPLTVTECTFSHNSANWSGGGIFNSGGPLTVTDSIFQNNIASGRGGGISSQYLHDSSDSPVTVTGSTFTGNSSGDSGGGIFNDFSPLTVTNDTFTNNSAVYGPDVCSGIMASQAIDFGPLANQTYGVSPIMLAATDTSNLPISYQVMSGPATISGDTLTVTGVGLIDVEASQAGDPTYIMPTHVDTSFTVTPATAVVSITPISGITYNGAPQETAGYSVTGVNGATLPSSDFTDTTVHTNAGTYVDNWEFADPSYATQFGTVTTTIAPAIAIINVTAYNVNYDGNQHTAIETATGINGINLNDDLVLVNTSHTNAGDYYVDNWTFIDPTGNYASATGIVHDNIAQINATIAITGYNIPYDGNPHIVAGIATGLGGTAIQETSGYGLEIPLDDAHTNH